MPTQQNGVEPALRSLASLKRWVDRYLGETYGVVPMHRISGSINEQQLGSKAATAAQLTTHEADTSTHGVADMTLLARKDTKGDLPASVAYEDEVNTFTHATGQTVQGTGHGFKVHAFTTAGGARLAVENSSGTHYAQIDDGRIFLHDESDNYIELKGEGYGTGIEVGTLDNTETAFRVVQALGDNPTFEIKGNGVPLGGPGGVTAPTLVGFLTNLGISSFSQTLLDDADAATARTTLGAQADLGADPPPPVDRQVFTASGTWTKPTAPSGFAAYTEVEVELIGGGGGGGSGRRGAAGTERGGGGGGAGGGYSRRVLPLAACAATEPVTVGTGGAGGAARTTDDTSGAGGSSGVNTQFGTGGTAADTRAVGGGNGGAGTTNGGQPGAASSARVLILGQVGAGGGSAAPAASPAVAPGYARGGGGGGGITGANVAGDGAQGGGQNVNNASAGSAGTGGAAGGSGVTATPNGIGSGGGGGGGGASITANAGAGGNGGAYGSGGGGGGASLNGFNSGKGGDGAAGIVVVTTR